MSNLLVNGLLHIRNYEYDVAIACFDELLSQNSENSNAIVGKAYCYYCLRDVDIAKRMCRDIDRNSINGTFLSYYEEIMGRNEYGTDNGSSSVNSTVLVENLINDGLSCIERFEYNSALDNFYKILDIDSDNIRAQVGIAYCFCCFNQYEEAHEFCKNADRESLRVPFLNYYDKIMKEFGNDETNPYSSLSTDELIAKGIDYIENIEYNNAVDCFDYILSIENNNEEAIVGKAYCIFTLGDYSLAQNMCNNINYNELDGTIFEYFKEIMVGDISFASDSSDNSTEYSEELNEEVNMLCDDGFRFIDNYKFKDAKKSFNKALKLQPRNTRVLYGDAVCLFNLGYYIPALKRCDEALKIDSNSIDETFYKKVKDKSEKHR